MFQLRDLTLLVLVVGPLQACEDECSLARQSGESTCIVLRQMAPEVLLFLPPTPLKASVCVHRGQYQGVRTTGSCKLRRCCLIEWIEAPVQLLLMGLRWSHAGFTAAYPCYSQEL